MTNWSNRRLASAAEAFTDGLGCFGRFADAGHEHTVIETAGGRASTEARGARWVIVVRSKVKQSIAVSYHAFKHAWYERRYLGEAAYRFRTIKPC